MARTSSQIKSIASILLTAAASASSGITVKRVLEGGRWEIPAACLALALGIQLALVFVESREEQELSLLHKARIDRSRQSIEENEGISVQIQKEIAAGNHDVVSKWDEVRRKLNE